VADERDGGDSMGVLLYGGGGKQLEESIKVDDAFADRRDEKGSPNGTELFLGYTQRDTVKDKQWDA
jgi:hypothetical protein